MTDLAIVTVTGSTVDPHDVEQGRIQVCDVGTTMSTDLPIVELGELLAQALNLTWAQGIDPVRHRLQLVVRFA